MPVVTFLKLLIELFNPRSRFFSFRLKYCGYNNQAEDTHPDALVCNDNSSQKSRQKFPSYLFKIKLYCCKDCSFRFIRKPNLLIYNMKKKILFSTSRKGKYRIYANKVAHLSFKINL